LAASLLKLAFSQGIIRSSTKLDGEELVKVIADFACLKLEEVNENA